MSNIRTRLSTAVTLSGLLVCSLAGPSLAQAASFQADSLQVQADKSYMQRVQWSAPLSAGLTPEQLLLALRKRELASTAYNPECTTLQHRVQRLRRAERRATAEHKAELAADLAQAEQRQQKLRCPQASKL